MPIEKSKKEKQDNNIILLHDKAILSRAIIDESTGFLNAPVDLARVGIQYYRGFELGLKDKAMEKIAVFRPPEEVFKKESIDAYTNLTITDNHPSKPVTVDNVQELQKGTVSHVVINGEVLSGIATITNKDVIEKIQDGKLEVSVGYNQTLKKQKGEYNGVSYDYVQTDIKPNHLAVVNKGRCGEACKIILDNKEKLMKFIIDGIEYDTEDTQLFQAIQKQQQTFDQEKEMFKKKLKEKEKEKEDMKKDKEKAEAAKDALESNILDEDTQTKLIHEKATLLVDAKMILGDDMPKCVCSKEIKTAVVNKLIPDMELTDKSEEYINSAYDIALENSKKAKGTTDTLANDFRIESSKTQITDRVEARRLYCKDQLGVEV